MERLTPARVRREQESGGIIIDVRSSEEYSASHVRGAINLTIEDLDQNLGRLPRGSAIVAYCNMRHRGQSRSELAAQRLEELGYHCSVLDGGFPAWEDAGLPVDSIR